MKYLVYFATLVAHWVLAWAWLALTGTIGLALMVLHWFLLNGMCFITLIERWLHRRWFGESHLDVLDEFEETRFYKWFLEKKDVNL